MDWFLYDRAPVMKELIDNPNFLRWMKFKYERDIENFVFSSPSKFYEIISWNC